MSLILLGILNSQVSGAAAGAYDLLETQILTSSAASVTFTGLGSYTDYKHLQIRMAVRSTRSNANFDLFYSRFNGISTNSYAWHYLRGNGSSVSSGSGTSQTALNLGYLETDFTSSNQASPAIMDILDFSSNNKNTTIRTFVGNTITPYLNFNSGVFLNTSAITQIELYPNSGDFSTGSRLSLYGVK